MNDAAIKTRLDKIIQQLNSLRMPKDRPTAGKAAPWDSSHSKLSEHELLDWLDFRLRYLVFDLEATHRENAILREILKDESSA